MSGKGQDQEWAIWANKITYKVRNSEAGYKINRNHRRAHVGEKSFAEKIENINENKGVKYKKKN